MVIQIMLGEREETLFRKFAEHRGTTVSAVVRTVVLEHIERELDLAVYEEAVSEFEKAPVTYTLKEVEKELNLREL